MRDRQQQGPEGILEETATGRDHNRTCVDWERPGWHNGIVDRRRDGLQGAHPRRQGPGRHRLDSLLLLVLLMLQLLGQLQVAKAHRALWLLQGQGDQVVLEGGKDKVWATAGQRD